MITISLKFLLAIAFLWFFLLALWFTVPLMMQKQVIADVKVPIKLSAKASAYKLDSFNMGQDEYRKAKELIYNSDIAKNGNMTYFKLGDLLTDWNTDDTSVSKWPRSKAHPKHGAGVPRFNFMDKEDHKKALDRRMQELPFILYNVPDLTKAVGAEGDFTLVKLKQNLGDEPREVEESEDNHFMYFSNPDKNRRGSKKLRDWKPPQKYTSISFPNFMEYAESLETDLSATADIAGSKHLYYMIFSATEGLKTSWIRDSFPFFNDKNGPTFFIVDPNGFKGINCRFGMKGVNAAAHYDGGRNFIAMVRGRKRYLLAPPSECPYMKLLPRGHPSARHSTIDWSDLEQVKGDEAFYNAKATEVVISSGDVLYIPSFWFHYIVSQDASIQCNARSGSPNNQDRQLISDCGF